MKQPITSYPLGYTEDEARRSKECVATGARGKLRNRGVQRRTGKHSLRFEDLAVL